MGIDRTTLALRLRQARESASLTQEVAASELGISRTAISQIESGGRAVTSLELERLARLYRRDLSDFFADEGPQEEDPFVVLHRLAPGLEEEPEIQSKVEHCLQMCQEGKSLEAILGRAERAGPPEYNMPHPRNVGEAVMQGAQIALQERQRLGLGNAPVADMAELINAHGVWATGVELPDAMSGLFINHTSTGLVILVNLRHSITRKRFSYAHEYGHALMDRDRMATISSSANANDLPEKRANAFAATFLMPPGAIVHALQYLQKGGPSRNDQAIFDVATEGRINAQVRTEPGSQVIGYQDVVLIMRWFNVSYEAAVYRLRSLNHISHAECDALLENKEMANRLKEAINDFSDEEPQPEKAARKLVSQVAHLAIEAYRRSEISRGRFLELADILEVDGKELLELAEALRVK